MFSLKSAMWSCFSSPLSRMRWATWFGRLLVLGPRHQAARRLEDQRRAVRVLCCLVSCVHRRPLGQARVQHVDQAGAHERQRLVLQMVANEADGHAVGGIGEPDLTTRAHVSKGTFVGAVHRRDARDERR